MENKILHNNNQEVEQKEKTRSEVILELLANFPLQLGTPDLMGHVIPRKKTVFLKKVDMSQSMIGSIHIPDTAKEDLCIGVIVAVGADVDDDIQIGQMVGYNRFANMEVLVQGQAYLRMADVDIYYFINPEGNVVHVDKAAEMKTKERLLQAGRKENIRVETVIDDHFANKKDRRLDEAAKRRAKGIIGKA